MNDRLSLFHLFSWPFFFFLLSGFACRIVVSENMEPRKASRPGNFRRASFIEAALQIVEISADCRYFVCGRRGVYLSCLWYMVRASSFSFCINILRLRGWSLAIFEADLLLALFCFFIFCFRLLAFWFVLGLYVSFRFLFFFSDFIHFDIPGQGI